MIMTRGKINNGNKLPNEKRGFKMLALHSFETLRVSRDNVDEFKKLAAESERSFIKILEKNNVFTRENKNGKSK